MAKESVKNEMSNHRDYSSLLDWHVVAALLVLLLNDLFWKQAMPGLVTGKLSDISGLFMIVALVGRQWPRAFLPWAIAVMLGFAYWKSAASQPVIDFINGVLPYRIGRVVDFTDLAAFLILPLAHPRFRRNSHPFPKGLSRIVMNAICMGTVAFSVAGTSAMPLRDDFIVQKKIDSGEMPREEVVDLLERVASEHGMEPCPDLYQFDETDGMYCDRDSGGQFKFALTWLIPEGANRVEIRITGDAGGPIPFIPGSNHRNEIKALRKHLLTEFAKEFGAIQMVIDVEPDGRTPIELVD